MIEEKKNGRKKVESENSVNRSIKRSAVSEILNFVMTSLRKTALLVQKPPTWFPKGFLQTEPLSFLIQLVFKWHIQLPKFWSKIRDELIKNLAPRRPCVNIELAIEFNRNFAKLLDRDLLVGGLSTSKRGSIGCQSVGKAGHNFILLAVFYSVDAACWHKSWLPICLAAIDSCLEKKLRLTWKDWKRPSVILTGCEWGLMKKLPSMTAIKSFLLNRLQLPLTDSALCCWSNCSSHRSDLKTEPGSIQT